MNRAISGFAASPGKAASLTLAAWGLAAVLAGGPASAQQEAIPTAANAPSAGAPDAAARRGSPAHPQ